MKVAELLELRRKNWLELEGLCDRIKLRRRASVPAAEHTRFAALYRAACADLALADAYQLPPNTVQYLHRLVGRAHNQLYRSRRFNFEQWGELLLHRVPRTVFNDRCVQLMALVFFGVFFLSALFARQKDSWPLYAQHILTDQFVEQIEKMYEEPLRGRSSQIDTYMAAFYIQHNTGIGLQCFVGGLFVIPGLYITITNAAQLGATFGYMDRPDVEGQYFFEFVTAHGPFELTAIALSAGAGLRLGLSWIRTGGLSRLASLHKTAKEAMPLMGSAMVLFFLAALVEGFLSPSELPFWFKRLVAILSSGMLMFYFVLLGYPRR